MRGIGRRLGRAAGIATAAILCVPLLAQSAQATYGTGVSAAGGQEQAAYDDPGATNPNRTAPEDGDAHVNIIGGQKTSVKDYPYIIAALREGGPRPMGQTCTGSVIGPKTILIAAHCKDSDGTKSFYYGADDLADPQGGVKIDVESYTQHPNYRPPNGWQTGWDVAVVQTVQEIPVPGGEYAEFATSEDAELSEPGNTGTAVGYGRVSDGENRYGHVKKADLPIVNGANTCGSIGNFNDAYMVCAGYADGHDGICQGDSGGPLVVGGTVVGVASWVKVGCGSYGAWGRLTGEMGDWVATQLPD
ncbi:trypsin-like serine protease, partial [Streptomyces sp. TRM70308]|uniref:S1 family peptidase n=1 Tax=Streptomyces sp. TRM70308 TaxID=3131932 RepID=UPI003D0569EC